jgi:protein O-GlcNAc transferase
VTPLVAFVCLASLSAAAPGVAGEQDLARGRQLLEQGAVSQAVTLLQEVVRKQPDNAEAHLLLGRALALVPEPAMSLAALRRAIQLRPASAEAHHTLGTALARFSDLEAARAEFERALALEPTFAAAHVSLALMLAERGELQPAQAHVARAIAIQGRSRPAAYSHYLMAQILREKEEPQEALQHLSTAIALRPDYAQAFLSQGAIRRRLLDLPGAIQAFETAVRLSPDDPIARAELGAAYLRDEKPERAIVHLEHALRLKPADRSTRYDLCRALRLANRTNEARQCGQQLSARIQAESADAEIAAAAANNEGVELESKGGLSAAIGRYRAAVALNPFNTVFRRNLALVLCRSGRFDEGITELRRVLDADPDDQAAMRALYIATEQARKAKHP